MALGYIYELSYEKYKIKKVQEKNIKRDLIQYYNVEFFKYEFHKKIKFTSLFQYYMKVKEFII